jgi:hypothetical protein
MPHLVDELFGRLQHEKQRLEVGNRIVELKKNKAIECLRILAKHVASIAPFLRFLK